MKKTFALATLTAFALTGCASSDKDPKPVRLCPQVAMIRELQRVQDYGTAAPAPGELVATSAMQKIEGGCEYGDEGGVDVRFTLSLAAARGPRMVGDKVGFPFFVSLIDPNNNVVTKNLMTESFTFGSGEKYAERKEPLHVFIPTEKDATAEGYRILLGYQLTEDQLKAVRAAEKVTPVP